MIKLAVIMDLPEGKLPGYYAQIVKALAGGVSLFDREKKETLIVSDPEELQAVERIMERYRVPFDTARLFFLLPDDALLTGIFTDYGFESRSGNRYIFQEKAAVFRLQSDHRELAESDQAGEQIAEHMIAKFTRGREEIYVVEGHLRELMTGIAKAYRCEIEWLA